MPLDITAEQAAKLSELSVERNASPVELVSEALDTYLQRMSGGKPEMLPGITSAAITDPEEQRRNLLSYFGVLPHLEDGMVFQDRMRNEWVREWDPEYDETLHG